MTEIQQNRYDQLVRRVANIVSSGAIVGDALNELFPMIDVESLNSELAFLAKWKLAFSSTTQLASVGNNSHTQLFNPADSGMIVVLERVDLNTSAGQPIRYALADIPLTNLTANEALRDTREGITQIPVAQCRDVQQVGGLALFGVLVLQFDQTFTLEEKRGLFTLAPGTGVTFATTVTNTELTANYLWRERVGEPAELNFP